MIGSSLYAVYRFGARRLSVEEAIAVGSLSSRSFGQLIFSDGLWNWEWISAAWRRRDDSSSDDVLAYLNANPVPSETSGDDDDENAEPKIAGPVDPTAVKYLESMMGSNEIRNKLFKKWL